MKKILLLILLLTLTTGCDVEYNLTIDDFYTEEVKFYYDSDFDNSNPYYILAYIYSSDNSELTEKVEGEIYYDNFSGLNYEGYRFQFTEDEFLDSNILNTCYSIYTTEENGVMKINTNNINSCFSFYSNLDNITIKITDVNNEIIYSNAQSVLGNIYVWNFNSDDRYDSYIEIQIGEEITDTEEDESSDNYSTYTENNNLTSEEELVNEYGIYIIVGTLAVFFAVIFSIVYIKTKNNNR